MLLFLLGEHHPRAARLIYARHGADNIRLQSRQPNCGSFYKGLGLKLGRNLVPLRLRQLDLNTKPDFGENSVEVLVPRPVFQVLGNRFEAADSGAIQGSVQKAEL